VLSFPVALRVLQNLEDLFLRFLSLAFRHLVELTGRGSRPVARPVPTQDNTTQKDENKHPCLEQNLNPRSQYPCCQYSRLRLRGHCDRYYRPCTKHNLDFHFLHQAYFTFLCHCRLLWRKMHLRITNSEDGIASTCHSGNTVPLLWHYLQFHTKQNSNFSTLSYFISMC
jgi:hypothetical protein